mmetsp:Transcript_23857/g.60792  ORF Transcript_23857/g.60792 Transcript_23857/m.60792 type:complete len:216 (-) Transcript_23857:441-1088(-)
MPRLPARLPRAACKMASSSSAVAAGSRRAWRAVLWRHSCWHLRRMGTMCTTPCCTCCPRRMLSPLAQSRLLVWLSRVRLWQRSQPPLQLRLRLRLPARPHPQPRTQPRSPMGQLPLQPRQPLVAPGPPSSSSPRQPPLAPPSLQRSPPPRPLRLRQPRRLHSQPRPARRAGGHAAAQSRPPTSQLLPCTACMCATCLRSTWLWSRWRRSSPSTAR